MSEVAKFFAEVARNVEAQGRDQELRALSREWLAKIGRHKYSHSFTWMGRPIIQVPQDVMAMQELIWRIRPDRIVETGVAHGGSLVFYASMLALLGGEGRVVGVDVEIRPHNRVEIEKHVMADRIDLVEGSSTDTSTVDRVRELVGPHARVLVVLDSNHTHAHVAKELELYSPLVKTGSYVVVMDTAIEDLPPGSFPDRPWDKGNNPKTAVWEFVKKSRRFRIDHAMDAKLLISVAPEGYLECVED